MAAPRADRAKIGMASAGRQHQNYGSAVAFSSKQSIALTQWTTVHCTDAVDCGLLHWRSGLQPTVIGLPSTVIGLQTTAYCTHTYRPSFQGTLKGAPDDGPRAEPLFNPTAGPHWKAPPQCAGYSRAS